MYCKDAADLNCQIGIGLGYVLLGLYLLVVIGLPILVFIESLRINDGKQ